MATMVGTELKLNLHIDLPSPLTMDDVDFEVDFFVCPSRKVTLRKDEGKRQDSDNYIFLLDTGKTGRGEIKMTVRVTIPDPDFGDRLEIESGSTKIKVI